MVPSEPQLHDDGDHLGLGAVVQILLDAAQPGGRVVHHHSPGSFQLANALAALQIIPEPVPARHQVGEPDVQSRRNEQERPPPLPDATNNAPPTTKQTAATHRATATPFT